MRLGSWLTVEEGAWTDGPWTAVSLAGSVGGEAGQSGVGIRVLVSVEIRCTMLDRQSRLETTVLRSLL